MTTKIILIGGGGHCTSVIDVIELEAKYKIIGIIDENLALGSKISGYEIIGRDEDIAKYAEQDNLQFLITVGQIKSYIIRKKIANKLKQNNCILATVVSPRAYVSSSAIIGKGTVVHHDVLINTGVEIGENCIINSKSLLEHGAKIDNFCHISTGAIVNGETKIKQGCFLGSNSTIAQNLLIPENSVISAGSFIKDNP